MNEYREIYHEGRYLCDVTDEGDGTWRVVSGIDTAFEFVLLTGEPVPVSWRRISKDGLPWEDVSIRPAGGPVKITDDILDRTLEVVMPDIGGDEKWIRDKRMSNHMLRRTARDKAAAYNKAMVGTDYTYRVESSVRGPFGWRVERYRRRGTTRV